MRPVPDRLAEIVVAFLLTAQAGSVARQVFVEDRFFAWSPHDSRNEYKVTALHHDQPVPATAIAARYQLPAMDWHAVGNIKAVIRTAEGRCAPEDRWQVMVTFRRNLGAPFAWTFPE